LLKKNALDKREGARDSGKAHFSFSNLGKLAGKGVITVPCRN
jgi:hypothetical protein